VLAVALVPNAIAFHDARRGVMGTGWQGCATNRFGCKPQGTVSLTTDGGATWTVVLRTPRPVVEVAWSQGVLSAQYDDGENIRSADGGRHWAPAVASRSLVSPCPASMRAFASGDWLLCTGEGGTGNQSKSLYRFTAKGEKRIAYTPFVTPGKAYGGISVYGYPQGITMARDGFGIIWEWRGTLYVTRDGGYHWVGLPRVAKPEVDFGMSAAALPHGVGFVILADGGAMKRRLLETTNAGRSWRVVHSWP
jgi:hypothetical protein